MTDARIACRAEDRDAILLNLLVGVRHAELFAELVARDDVGLRELEIEVVVAGARIQRRRDENTCTQPKTACSAHRSEGPAKVSSLPRPTAFDNPGSWTGAKVYGLMVDVFDQE